MTLEELKAYLINKANYSQNQVDSMSGYQLLNAYLEWNGLYMWTSSIISVVKAIGIDNL